MRKTISGMAPRDAFTRSWLAQATLRMRRELTWLWRKREPVDLLAEWLERDSTAEERLKFFAEDPTAKYLDQQIREGKPPLRGRTARGGFAWLVRELDLSQAEIFMVALALACGRDAGAGHLIGTLQGDLKQQLPTLGLAQRLWDDPQDLAPLSSPAHPLFARGILRRTNAGTEWDSPIFMPILIARMLEKPSGRVSAPELECVAEAPRKPGAGETVPDIELQLLAGRMAHPPHAMHVAPVSIAFTGNALDAKRAAPALRGIAALTGRPIYGIRQSVVISAATLESSAAYCWLSGADLMLPSQGLTHDSGWQNLLRPYPIYVFAAVEKDEAPSVSSQTLPTLKIPSPDFAQRRALWHEEFAIHKIEADPDAVREVAYRFRIDGAAIAEVAAALKHTTGPVTLHRLIAACQQQVGVSMGSHATLVVPRFGRSDLILDSERSTQFDHLLAAMRNISRVHAEWGTGHVWGDSGVSALFAGAPGTGKTMAAEVLAAELEMPMYHVDLSQILNKYIGETEKNLRKLFDAAEQAEVVLFFDEADSLFGQRTQVRSSTDRYANMDVGYLLERMDRFRGLAILATNRKKDLDEAFLRRLRFAIDFPLPSEPERKAIWRKCIPPQVSAEGIDFDLLAREFALSGGNIRSIVLNACLQAASAGSDAVLSSEAVMNAIGREYEKIGRPLTREQKVQWQLDPAQAAAKGSLAVIR